MAVTVDGTKQNSMPTSPLASNGSYYKVDVSCTSSKTEGLWDYNAWRLNLDYIESNSKCNLEFTSSMSKEQYDEYIQTGVALRRNTYRGKDITELWQNGDLYEQISNGTFNDIYVGDYITTSDNGNNVTWLIADLDNYLYTGGLKKHHATIIPASYLGSSNVMNDTMTTQGAYKGSKMYTDVLPQILKDYIVPVFQTHVITYKNYVTNQFNSSKINQWGSVKLIDGTVSGGGATDGWESVERQLDLMSEVNVYGTVIMSSSFYDIGIDSQQYAIFRLNPKLINSDGKNNIYSYWLKGVVSSTDFVIASNTGMAGWLNASLANAMVRPRFLID